MIYTALEFFGIHDPSDTLVMAIATIIMGLIMGGALFGVIAMQWRYHRIHTNETHLRQCFYHDSWMKHHQEKAEAFLYDAATYLSDLCEKKDGIVREKLGYGLGSKDVDLLTYNEENREGTEVKVTLPLTAFNEGKDWKSAIRTELRSKREPEPEAVMAARGMGA